ncbi:hypothetical protein Z517_08872 [Fonsecaea pedrosoi CBS 271.37]|uniref:RRM domain-containing protein n=1 Tax=Fonsecaea pedrosoi CBS 271.37 TaxID=1442368 RepID=A0A0D2EXY4_9EURO|nr:uncharacterized protein Z517_08872 [Fonsecaea pedrosoi CBS 271.37]KIW79032.1 hypothetical protein Z517_08872 [Fonsecaea pedrosoi CBS 271.37]
MSKKRKRDLAQSQDQAQDDSIVTRPQSDQKSQTVAQNPPASAKSKGQLKQEKSERRAKRQKKSKDHGKGEETPAAVNTVAPTPDPTSTETSASNAEPQEQVPETHKKRKASKIEKNDDEQKTTTPTRFIVFVGNLPFETTSEQIKVHFSKLSPTSVRLSTDRKTGKSKGFAFVEFDNYDKMKTCLKLYHHSMFDPDGKDGETGAASDQGNLGEQQSQRQGKKSKGRRINVELTAGGGGKSKDRKAKIKTKNDKLKEERERRRLKEKAERDKVDSKKKGPPETGANAIVVVGSEVKDDRGDIHPSRLSRVKH